MTSRSRLFSKKMGLNRYGGLLYPCVRVDLLSLNYDIKKAEMILDSGASVSVIHLSLLKGVEKSMKHIVGREFITVNGENIGNGLFASFERVVESIKKKIKVVDALIVNMKEPET